jgi:hypothetical protein
MSEPPFSIIERLRAASLTHCPLVAISLVGEVVADLSSFREAVRAAEEQAEKVAAQAELFRDLPVNRTGIVFRMGLTNDLRPAYVGWRRKYSVIHYRVSFDLRTLHQLSATGLSSLFTLAALRVLICIAHKYNRSPAILREARQVQLGDTEVREWLAAEGLDVLDEGESNAKDEARKAGVEGLQELHLCLRLSDGSFGDQRDLQLLRLDPELVALFERAGTGFVEGNEFGGGECIFFICGPSADAMMETLWPWLRGKDFRPGSYVLKVPDPDDDSVERERISLPLTE